MNKWILFLGGLQLLNAVLILYALIKGVKIETILLWQLIPFVLLLWKIGDKKDEDL